MNATAHNLNVANRIEEIVTNVFDTMLLLPVTRAECRPPAREPDRVSGTLGIAGDNVIGAIYIHLPLPLAQRAARIILGLGPQAPVEDNDVHDIVGELTNMVGGGFKSTLCNVNYPCAMSTPSIIRGSFDVETPMDLQRETFCFQCQDDHLTVEVHLKLD